FSGNRCCVNRVGRKSMLKHILAALVAVSLVTVLPVTFAKAQSSTQQDVKAKAKADKAAAKQKAKEDKAAAKAAAKEAKAKAKADKAAAKAKAKEEKAKIGRA